MGYIPTGDETIVLKETSQTVEINLTSMIDEFQSVKTNLLNLSKVKTVADQETLDYWNEYKMLEVEKEKEFLNNRTIDLYNIVKPIHDAGLFPSQYETQYTQLENYVNNL